MLAWPSSLVVRALSPSEVIEAESDRQLYALVEPFAYKSALAGDITVPANYVTDFASIPRFALWFIDDDAPQILFASVVHDYLYTMKGDLGRGDDWVLSRRTADRVLREAMLGSGASRLQAFVVFFAVRLGGGSHWR